MAVSRETLYEEIWAEPSIKVAKRYGVSSSFLARVCERLRIPTPPRGYWAQAAVGKAQPRPALTEAEPGDELEWSRNGRPPLRAAFPLPSPPSSKEQRPARPPSSRPKRHGLLFNAREEFLGGKTFDSGYLRPGKYAVMDLLASKGILDRALNAANDLYLALEDKGYPVALSPKNAPYRRPELDDRLNRVPRRDTLYHGTWSPVRPTIAMLGTVAFALTVFEPSELVEVRYVDGKYVRVTQAPKRRRTDSGWTTTRDLPSGRLAVRASSPYARVDWTKEWYEPSPGDLASMLAQIIADLEAASPTLAKLVREAEHKAEIEHKQWEEQQRRWRQEEMERRQRENLEASRAQLFAIIDAWWQIRGLQSFFDDTQSRIARLPDEERPALLDRLERARELLGPSDALQHFRSWKAPDER